MHATPLIFTLAITLAALPAAADPITGAARVIDGDTIDIGDTRIRLWGIDAPEDGQRGDIGHGPVDIGDMATVFMGTFTEGLTVACEAVDTDRDGRTVARCHVNQTGLGSAIVLAGLAWDYERYSDAAYATEQAQAREAGRGVWAGQCMPPWEWRSR